MVRVVREDPQRKGLLFAGTDASVYVSWDDGGHWRPLGLNLPATPVTDLDVHGNDLVASTFGRSLWILDDISPLRQMTTGEVSGGAQLFPPAAAMRARWDNNQDTPFPAETPAGENPPDGAVIDYYLPAGASGAVSLTIFDEAGQEIRRYGDAAGEEKYPAANVPSYWFGAGARLGRVHGVNRFVWDLRYSAPPSLPYGYSGDLLDYAEFTLADHAIPGETPRQQPQGPLVAPGSYRVELRVGGETMRQTLRVELDPRLRVSQAELEAQLELAQRVARGMRTSAAAYRQVAALRKALQARKPAAPELDKKLEALEKGPRLTPGFGPANRDLSRLLASVEGADAGPTESVQAAVQQMCGALDADLAKWRELSMESGQDAGFTAGGEPSREGVRLGIERFHLGLPLVH